MRHHSILPAVFIALLFAACAPLSEVNPEMSSGSKTSEQTGQPSTTTPRQTSQSSKSEKEHTPDTSGSTTEIDYETVRPNEAGKIMVVMFHRFTDEYGSGSNEFAMTAKAFRELLQILYDKGYRLISLDDYTQNNIDVAAGCIPVVFTFDDGTPGQFSLEERQGRFEIKRDTAVDIILDFCSKHPEFGAEGTFFLNLGLNTFSGAGTLKERLEYLVESGFEIGNHTLTHARLDRLDTDGVKQEIGGNNARLVEIMGISMKHFSLPYGIRPQKGLQHLAAGEYKGIPYKNISVLEVGWDPYLSPVSRDFDPLAIHRVRAPGMEPVKGDLYWWLERLSREEQFVSDGDPGSVTVPEELSSNVDPARLKGKKLITY